MGFLDFLGPIGTALGGVGGILGNIGTGRAQNKQNAFNAAQAEQNRQFQAQQAEIARDWQEQQYLQYSSPSAMVRQYEDAGLNPALMYGSNLQTSTGSSPAPSGSAASGSALPRTNPLQGVAESIASFAKLKAEIDNINADTDSKRAAAGLSTSQIEVNKQSVEESQSRISKLIEETKNESEKRGLIIAQKLLTNIDSQLKTSEIENLSYDILRQKFDKEFKDKFGFYPDSSAIKSGLGIFAEMTRNVEYFGGKMINFVKDLFE